jgi:pilin isopeptide linkage protein
MFKNCSALVGGNGTKWSSANTGATYARIDTASTPGYFTEKASAKSKASVPNTGSDGTAPSARRLVNTGATSHSNMFPRPTKTESGKPSTGEWGLGSENAATSYSADELPDHITAGTWYAQAQTYAVSFDANGGSGSMATKNVDSLTLPKPTFYRLGYTPTGWNTAADGKGTHYDVGATFTPTADTTLYAEWTKDTNVTKNDDGTYTVTLKAGEAIDLSGLPAGSTYEVVESSVPGWTLTGSENANGTIEADQDMTATFTNAYTPGQTSATISATKTMDGTIPTDTYDFELKDSEGKVLQTVRNDGSSVAFAPIAYTSAGTYTYTIDEVAGSNRNVSYDSHVETVTVTVTDDGHGNLSAAVAYDSDGASFANTSKPGSLAIAKGVTVSGEYVSDDNVYASKLFDMAVSLTDASGKALTGTYAWTSVSGRSGTVASGGTVSVSQNDYVTITGIPAGTRYTVSEPSVPAGWTRVMNPRTGSYDESGAIASNKTSYVAIVNDYSLSGSLALKARKTFDGTLEAGQFSFTATVTGPDGKATTTSATNDANGDISFSPVALAQAGTYKLSIAEDAGDDADVTYDTTGWPRPCARIRRCGPCVRACGHARR